MSSAQRQVGVESPDIATLVVDDRDEALVFYTETLGFEKRSDEAFEVEGETGRWLTVGRPGHELAVPLVELVPYYDAETREVLEEKRGPGRGGPSGRTTARRASRPWSPPGSR